MKKIFILILVITSSLLWAKITPKQDENNVKSLKRLDDNLVETIKLISAYNSMANKVSPEVKGLGIYRRFLMNTTIETGKLRDQIKAAQKADQSTREILIRNMIISIKSDVKFYEKHISGKRDRKNKKYLNKSMIAYLTKIKDIRRDMMVEEKKIINDGKFTKKYFALHSANYFYSLLIDFMKISGYLTPKNREYLTDIVKSINQ